MKDSYLMFYSQPESGNISLNDIWFAGHEISNWNSLSIDWAGGGIVSTLEDLKVFIRALNHYEIISEKTLKEMYVFKHKFVTGLYYGLGFIIQIQRLFSYAWFSAIIKGAHGSTGNTGVL